MKEILIQKEDYLNYSIYEELVKKINDNELIDKNKINKYFIITLGCQMNERDSEIIEGMLLNMGFVSAQKVEDADLVIYNTCAIRENAENKFFGNIGALKHLKESSKDVILAVCGCSMQEGHIVNEIKKNHKHINIIFGTFNIYKFPKLLYDFLSERKNTGKNKQVIDIFKIDGNIVENMPSKRKYAFKGFINIMYGCNNFCTYCIVPYTRGRERSRKKEDILKEARSMVNSGAKEIMLLGQNVNSYGKFFDSYSIKDERTIDYKFSDLLKDINEIEGLKRLRFMTSHPKDISDDLIYSFKELDKLCNSLHLPVQSGSSRILEKMNRHYNRDKYLEKIYKIKKVNPDIALTTDIIVGFPGETDEDFEDTLSLVKEVEFDSCFIFLYSRRKNTIADKMGNQVPEEIKKERFNKILELTNLISEKKNKKYKGNIENVLVEGYSKKDVNKLTGRNEKNKLINFVGNANHIGEIVKVKIEKTKSFSLEGIEI